MFVITLEYKKEISFVEKHLEAHRAFLKKYYASNILIASGAKIPRTGGVILCNTKTREEAEAFVSEDPFYIEDIATYTIIEFTPTMYHQDFTAFL